MSKVKKFKSIHLTCHLICGLFFGISFDLLAQEIPVNHQINLLNQSQYVHGLESTSQGEKYSLQSDRLLGDATNVDDDFMTKRQSIRSLFARKLLFENLFRIDTGNVHFTLDPIFEANLGQQSVDTDDEFDKIMTTNSRGFLLRGWMGEKLYFESSAMENQASFPYYLQEYINEYDVVPGQGRVKDFKENQFDYSNARGYIFYQPWKFLSIQAGQDKHFIGSGYRSVIHSDNSFNYPFARFRVNTLNEKWSYTIMYNEYINLDRLPGNGLTEPPFYRKGGSVMQLRWKPNKNFEIGIVESHIWQSMDTNGSRVSQPRRYNPLMISQIMANGWSDEKRNSLMALDLVYRWKIMEAYGQYVLSDSESQRNGYQIGFKIFPIPNLAIILESNRLANKVFDHDSTNLRFMNYNQSIGHPQGNGMSEYLARIEYRKKRVLISYGMSYAFSDNPSTVIYKTNYTSLNLAGSVAYLVNPATNMQLIAGINQRQGPIDFNNKEEENTWLYLAFRTKLFNRYYDF